MILFHYREYYGLEEMEAPPEIVAFIDSHRISSEQLKKET